MREAPSNKELERTRSARQTDYRGPRRSIQCLYGPASMLMVDAGYFAKVIDATPTGLGIEGIREICSVSTCISVAPEEWVYQWRHNDFGWFNSVDDAWSRGA
jgi:hypothetical protein